MTEITVMPVWRLRGWRRGHLVIVLAAAVLVIAFLVGYLPRRRAHSKLVTESATAAQGAPRVAVTRAVAVDAGRELKLPASLVAQQRTLVYARASGYVRRWLVDIGTQVRTGDLLLELDTPELNQQLAQARAMLGQRVAAVAQAQANRSYAYLTAERMDTLRREKLISQQEDDQARLQAAVWDANVRAAQADLEAQRATVRQLEQLVSFGKVVAPFTGTITQRLVDTGGLVNAGAGSSGAALYQIEATNPLRAFVDVPQPFVPSIRVGASAKISVRQYPGRVFSGKVARTAGALEPASRTLRIEVEVPNPKAELFAGMYGEVALAAELSHRVIRVPSSAVLADARGVHVAVVDSSGRVHLVAVQLGLDNGDSVDLVAGLKGGERVITTPASDIADGAQVQSVGN